MKSGYYNCSQQNIDYHKECVDDHHICDNGHNMFLKTHLDQNDAFENENIKCNKCMMEIDND